ncbi:MAG: hypothetical protein IPJ76_16930 [Flavobacteriales bacterium]|nr:MAG: hypothetical protein IPJ76_16930 [Flavobacteriales bacterium]
MQPRRTYPCARARALAVLSLTLCLWLNARAQLVIWADEFENGCNTGCYASAYTTGVNGIWTVTNVGAQGTCPNQWFISCRENGNATSTCGTDCTTNNESLHIGNELVGVCASPNGCIFCPAGDCGAAYDAGCPPAFCTFCLCGCLNTTTNKRAESPTINLSAYTNVTLNFKYMENGQTTSDDFLVEYWNGAVWAALSNPPKTPAGGCGSQGQWTQYSVALPASANNNPAVRVGFRWQNNNDASGADPSVAIDDVQLTVAYVPTCVGPFVNEVSNGPATEKEYIELMVCGPPCTTVDLRNWKIDDNNGAAWNGFGSVMVNSGVSTGHLRFANVAQWAAVPTGSIIVIYNNTDLNALLPPNDPNDSSPVDSVYVLPVNHASIQSCATLPSATSSSGYNPCGFGAGNWTRVVMRNDGDAAQVRYPNGQYFHGVSYGPNTQNMNTGGADALRISTVNHAGRVIYFNALDPRSAANFTSAVVAGNETPGAANNAANLAFRRALQCATSLPVELLSFTARNDGPAVLLEWSTASEKDNAHFTVERSKDGQRFNDLLHLPGAGDSQTTLHYRAHDVDPVAGTTFYRLRQTDHDGATSHSNIVAVHRSTASNGLSATLSGDHLVRIEHPCQLASWELLDPLGRMIGKGTSGEGPVTDWNAPTHITGAMFLRVHCGAEAATFKLVF